MSQSNESLQHDKKTEHIPVIDQNLQNFSLNPIYSHYIGINGGRTPVSLQIPEEEMNQLMLEAKRSYMAWKQMQERLQQIIQEYEP